jgi:Fungal protein of unknown function (DUF1752)
VQPRTSKNPTRPAPPADRVHHWGDPSIHVSPCSLYYCSSVLLSFELLPHSVPRNDLVLGLSGSDNPPLHSTLVAPVLLRFGNRRLRTANRFQVDRLGPPTEAANQRPAGPVDFRHSIAIPPTITKHRDNHERPGGVQKSSKHILLDSVSASLERRRENCVGVGGRLPGTLDFTPAQQRARAELLGPPVFSDWGDDAAKDADLQDPGAMQEKDPLGTQIWKLYSRTKSQLPNQERMENLSWRLMAMQLKRREQETRYVGRIRLRNAVRTFLPRPLPTHRTSSLHVLETPSTWPLRARTRIPQVSPGYARQTSTLHLPAMRCKSMPIRLRRSLARLSCRPLILRRNRKAAPRVFLSRTRRCKRLDLACRLPPRRSDRIGRGTVSSTMCRDECVRRASTSEK